MMFYSKINCKCFKIFFYFQSSSLSRFHLGSSTSELGFGFGIHILPTFGQLGLFPSRHPSQLSRVNSAFFFLFGKMLYRTCTLCQICENITEYVLLLSIRASIDLLLRAFSYTWIEFCVYCYKAEPKSNYT